MDEIGQTKSRFDSNTIYLAGAMAPVTMAGAVAQSIAEGLSAIALAQYIILVLDVQ